MYTRLQTGPHLLEACRQDHIYWRPVCALLHTVHTVAQAPRCYQCSAAMIHRQQALRFQLHGAELVRLPLPASPLLQPHDRQP